MELTNQHITSIMTQYTQTVSLGEWNLKYVAQDDFKQVATHIISKYREIRDFRLYVTHQGDPSVGIESTHYEVDSPFCSTSIDLNNITSDNREEMDDFKAQVCEMYADWHCSVIVAYYGWEIKDMQQQEYHN